MEDLIKELESLKIDGIFLDEFDRAYNFAINDAIRIIEKYKGKKSTAVDADEYKRMLFNNDY